MAHGFTAEEACAGEGVDHELWEHLMANDKQVRELMALKRREVLEEAMRKAKSNPQYVRLLERLDRRYAPPDKAKHVDHSGEIKLVAGVDAEVWKAAGRIAARKKPRDA